MSYSSLAHFVKTLEEAGELIRITLPVATELQITELANREMKKPEGGKALLFEKPTIHGVISKFPVLINAMGSRRRMAMALGLHSVEELSSQLEFLMKAKPPKTFRDGLTLLRQGIDLVHARPRYVKRGPCQEVVYRLDQAQSDFSLSSLPILKCWPHDGGRFVTLPTVYTKDPDTGDRNIGMYRMQVYDGSTTGMHWQVHKVAARHGKGYYERGEPMPVAVALGGDPVFPFSAMAPLPDGIDEILFAGFARKRSVELVKCISVPLEVPAESDIVIEGFVYPGETRPEGPFGDHTGFYTPVDDYPVFHVTAITHRREAIYPATIVGVPPMEDFYMGEASVRIFLPIFKMNFPEIVDMALPAEGVFHNLVFVSIRKQYPWQAFKVMHGLWGMGQMMFSKYIIVVDEDCNVQNTSEVIFRLCSNTDPQRDSIVTKNPSDSLDHAPTIANLGSHMGFDATKKLPGEGYTRGWPDLVKMDPAVEAWADQFVGYPG
ncbi:MAG: menaquinone biosynthesis decarboxylase [Verrucomicrobiae bacterium]|jgi:4-hydroxy-3-polyprenylbenzoate decarboxylase|nr:menaquinone biosynthesis decarboxylase [Verrucomicrobiae bacterium]